MAMAATACSFTLALAVTRASLAVLLHDIAILVGAAVAHALPVIMTEAVAVAAVPPATAAAAAPVVAGNSHARSGRQTQSHARPGNAPPRARSHGETAWPQLLRRAAAATATACTFAVAAFAFELIGRVLVPVLAVTARHAACPVGPPPALAGARSDDFGRDGPAHAVGHTRYKGANHPPAVGRHLLGQARHRLERRRAWAS